MIAKYTILFFVAGLVVGLLVTDARRYLTGKWLWYGAATSLLIFLPNLIWQVQDSFVSLDFLRYIHARDVRIGRTQSFLLDQLYLMLFASPLGMAGLCFYLFSRTGRRFRALGWMYVVPLLLFVIGRGRGYYLAAAYPMLYAAGTVWCEHWVASLRRQWAGVVRSVAWTALAANIVVFAALALPVASVNSGWWKAATKINGDLKEEIGWGDSRRNSLDSTLGGGLKLYRVINGIALNRQEG
jgi:hypothetical protein